MGSPDAVRPGSSTIPRPDDGTGQPWPGHDTGPTRSVPAVGLADDAATAVAAMASPPAPASAPSSGAVVVQDVTKVYEPSPPWLALLLRSAIKEPLRALDHVAFSVAQGETCVIVGPNGAGKSTLFRILTGLTTPTSGTAQILGRDISAGRRVRSLIGYMPAEDRNLMLRHTCAQNLAFRGRLQGMSKRDLPGRIDEVLDQVGLLHARDRAATSLSTGMKARLQLAAALLHRPRVLILDEPTSTVDPINAHELLTLIEDLTRHQQLSVVLSSHRLEEIDALDNKVVFLDKGRVIHDGNLNELRALWETPRYRMTFAAGADVTAIARRLDRSADLEVDTLQATIEVATERPAGDLLAQLGPDVAAVTSFDRVLMPLRELLRRLVVGEIEGMTA
jgi:ABC-2 type transport system ATP-binding protein